MGVLRRQPGSALIDTLLAIVAVAAVAGLASPMLASMRQRAANGSEMSQLHELGVAQGIYTADSGEIPLSTKTLVDAGLVSSAACASPLDLSPDGIANDVDIELGQTSRMYRNFVPPYRCTYLGIREYGLSEDLVHKSLKDAPGAGWLVSLTTSLRRDPKKWNTWYTGNYRRLMLDGSVQVRQHEPVAIKTMSGKTTAEHPFFMFRDGSKEWKEKFISG